MKKFSRIFLCCLLVIVVALTAVACTAKDANGLYILKAPKVTLNGNTVSWNPVKNAKEYGVVIDGNLEKEVVTASTSYPLMNITKTTTVKVRAIGDKTKYANSDYSADITFDPILSLISPSGVAFVKNADGSLKITWLAVENATSYVVYTRLNNALVGEPITVGAKTLETTIPASSVAKAGAYMFSIKARGGDKFLDSAESTSVTYIVKVTLANPQKVVLATTSGSGTISFKKVENAERYLIRAKRDGVEYKTLDNPSINSEDVTMDIKKFSFNDVGLYTFEVLATRKSNNSAYYADSEWVQVMLKKDETKGAEMRLYPAPTNVKIGTQVVAEKNVDMLTWDAVEGAKKYHVGLKSSLESTTSDVPSEKLELDLTNTADLKSDSVGGKALLITVCVAENLDEGILRGLSATDKEALSYQSSEEPKMDGNAVYQVEKLMHLAYIAKAPSAKYKLMNNINAGGSNIYGFTSEFSGEFDGGEFTISNFKIVPRKGEKNVSLFGKMTSTAVVKNLGLIDSKFNIKEYTLLDDENKNINCAYISIDNAGTIENIINNGMSNSTTSAVDTEGEFGGVALVNSGTIKGCSIIIKASSFGRMAGIAVENSGKLFNNMVYASAMSTQTVQASAGKATVVDAIIGGIAAVNSGSIEACGMDGASSLIVKAQGVTHNAYAGGLVGKTTGGTITKCYVSRVGKDANNLGVKAEATGSQSLSFAGGLIGFAENTAISSVYNQFMAANSSKVSGGLIGQLNSGSLDNSYSIATAVIGITKGGFVGVNSGAITKSYYDKSSITDKTTNASSASDEVVGLTNITKKEDLSTLQLTGFQVNDKVVDNYMILSDIPYRDRAYGFTDGTAKKGEERKIFAKFYLGSQVIEAPTFKAPNDAQGTRYDKYVIKNGDVEYIMARIIKINV